MPNGKLLMLRLDKKLFTLHMQDKKLLSVQVYEEEQTSLIGNIYVGKVQKIARNIQAAFVEIGKGLVCFLPFDELKNPILLNRSFSGKLQAGDELLVQVAKDAVKTKQPTLTTKLSISGKYLVTARGANKLGLSSKIGKAKSNEITEYLLAEELIDNDKRCISSANQGIIIRTNAENLTDLAVLKDEWQYLQKLLTDICNTGIHRTCFSCLYQTEKPYIADLKNFYIKDFQEIVTDCKDIYQELLDYYSNQSIKTTDKLPEIRFYKDDYPLEKLYSVKTLLHEALQSRVWLKSGGYLIIEPTEALTVIDVNTGKYEGKEAREEAFYRINLEAAAEITHQLKLRNISGIIIVDFINMEDDNHRQSLMKTLDNLLKEDRTPTKLVDITSLGLVEITRKRINRPLRELLKAENFK